MRRQEIITPDMAAKYLDRNIASNRRMRMNWVNRMAADMRAGEWEEENPQNTLIFNTKGQLVDGQHRLMAIITSGCAVKMFVEDNVPDSVHMFDVGAKRSTTDVLTMGGMDRDIVNNVTVAAVNLLMWEVFGYRTPTTPIIGAYLERYGQELKAAQNCAFATGTGKGRTATLTAAVYCAMRYGVPEATLREFCAIVNTGLQNEGWQKPPIHFKNYLDGMQGTYGRSTGTKSYRGTTFAIACRAIYDFVNRVGRRRGYTPSTTKVSLYVDALKRADRDFVKEITGGTK